MNQAERDLFNEMIRQNIKAFTEKDEGASEYHREMYTIIKHVLWEHQLQQKGEGNAEGN